MRDVIMMTDDQVNAIAAAQADPNEACDRDGLRRRALALRGEKSIRMIAKELGVSHNVVAGLFFRADHPGERITGAGRGKVRGARAKQTACIGGKPGRQFRWQIRHALDEIIAVCRRTDAVHLRQEVLQIATTACKNVDARRDRRRAKAERARAL